MDRVNVSTRERALVLVELAVELAKRSLGLRFDVRRRDDVLVAVEVKRRLKIGVVAMTAAKLAPF